MDFKGCNIKYKDALFSKYLMNKEGEIYSVSGDKILKPWLDSRGYPQIDIWTDDRHRMTVKCHLLVAHTFIDIPKRLSEFDSLQVNHKDGDKLNYKVSNLEWMTPRENIEHAYNTDLKDGDYLDKNTVNIVCKYIDSNKSVRDINHLTGLPSHVISDIKYGRTYKHISKNYKFNKED